MIKRFIILLCSLLFTGSLLSAVQCITDTVPMQAVPTPALPLLTAQQLVSQLFSEQIYIQGGSYQMGSADPQYQGIIQDSNHVHPVTLSSFYFSKYLVSSNQLNSYLALMGKLEQVKENQKTNLTRGMTPAMADWQTAHDYCAWLGDQTDLPFSLPTEAQWEYVARNRGKDDPYPTSNGQLEVGINYPGKMNYLYKLPKPGPFGDTTGNALPINAPPVNKLGIHQMGSNSPEWMQDWYAADYYYHSPEQDPQGPKTDNGDTGFGDLLKVTRGIDWSAVDFEDYWRVSASNYHRMDDPMDETGVISFRCVINSWHSMDELAAMMDVHQMEQSKNL